ncbi:hypothetical protein ACN26Z_00335 [Verrucosispora sp. WMMD703]|uniref:hypothetical protein n=1 Tax=Verrucosispora sp. WMMD703 TaxID=3403463 RepID=UPI003B962F7E
MTSSNTRPAQLAPVRVGRGRVVHLGNLSSLTGPAGEPRYVPGSCGAGTRGDTVSVGAAVTEPIDCRTCARSNPVRVAWINATVIAATKEPVTLPHTGLTVPHTQLRVDGPIQLGPGRAEQHRLYLGDRFVGWITTHPHHPHRSATYRTNSLGGRELDEYAQQCRLFTGEPATVADVLAELVREHNTALDIAKRVAAGHAPVRLMAHTLTGDGEPIGQPYPVSYAGLTCVDPLMADNPIWRGAIAYALHHDRPASTGQHWQLWTSTGWTRLPEVLDLAEDSDG